MREQQLGLAASRGQTCHVIMEGNQVDQVQFTLSKYMVTIPDQLPSLHVPRSVFFYDFPRDPRNRGCTSRERDGRKIIKIRERGGLGRQQFADKAFDTDTFVRQNVIYHTCS